MIDFRYHLVSLIAVFLAVALGIVIGTTQLNGSVLENLQTQVTGLQEDKRALEDTTQSLQTRVDADDQFSDAIAPAVVGATLTDRTVVVLVADEEVADETVDDLTDLLGTAGASVTGTVRLTPAYSDPSTAQSLQSYVTGPGRPAGLVLPESSDPGELTAAVLGQVLMRSPSATADVGSGTATEDLTSVLAALSGLDVLSYDTAPVERADFAVVLDAGAGTEEAAASGTPPVLQLTAALDRYSSGAVLAGDLAAAGPDGLLGLARADGTLSTAFSTVDNVDSAAGRISTVLALSREATGVSGKYGTGEDTEPAPAVEP